MLSFLPHTLKGLVSILGYTINTIALSVPLFLLSLFKFILPFKAIVVFIDKLLIQIATLWIGFNSLNSKIFCNIEWDIRGLEKLKKKEWYLVISNHQSWVDILALQTTLNRKIPMLKFFLKKELIWVPFLGVAWWALDFPFMKRYSHKQLEAKPELKGKDIESTKKACRKFKNTPVSVMNFVEGTRFTPGKRNRQESPFEYLLKPKAGGIAFVLSAMGEYLHEIVDVTIVYPDKRPSFWEYISGRVNKIIIDINVIPIDENMLGDYFNDPVFKRKFFNWLNQLWHEKNDKIRSLIKSATHT